jgi:hypothetical protein
MRNLLPNSHSMKRRFQFGLSTLIAATFVAAMIACWFGYRLRAVAIENWAVEQLATKGACVVLYDEGAYIHFGAPPRGLCGTGLRRVIGPSATTVSFADKDMNLLSGLQRICSVDFQRTTVSGRAIAQFKQANPKCYVTP